MRYKIAHGDVFFYCLPVFADDAKVIGPVYPITETDFIQMAQKKIQEKMSGEDGKSWQDQQRSIRVAADRPTPVLGLRPTIHSRRWLFDPSFVIPIDVRSANGPILLKSGSRFNPLKSRIGISHCFFLMEMIRRK